MIRGKYIMDKSEEYRRNLAKKLVPYYKKDPVLIASLCDEVLDRSGNMLGWLRTESSNCFNK